MGSVVSKPNTCLISLGANLGDRGETLEAAVSLLDDAPGIRVDRISRFYRSPAIGGPADQPEFLNAAARIRTSLDPRPLLETLLAIESQLGRVRQSRWGPRSIDLDLLLFEDIESWAAELLIPHPRMAARRFVLLPSVEVAADLVHSSSGLTVAELSGRLDSLPNYFPLAGYPVAQQDRLAAEVAEAAEMELLVTPTPRPAAGDEEQLGRPLAESLQWLMRCAEQLERHSNGHAGQVSSFWIGEPLVDAAQAACEATFEALADEVKRLAGWMLGKLVFFPLERAIADWGGRGLVAAGSAEARVGGGGTRMPLGSWFDAFRKTIRHLPGAVAIPIGKDSVHEIVAAIRAASADCQPIDA